MCMLVVVGNLLYLDTIQMNCMFDTHYNRDSFGTDWLRKSLLLHYRSRIGRY